LGMRGAEVLVSIQAPANSSPANLPFLRLARPADVVGIGDVDVGAALASREGRGLRIPALVELAGDLVLQLDRVPPQVGPRVRLVLFHSRLLGRK